MKDTRICQQKQTKKLFRGDKDWWNNACLNYLHDQWNIYTVGYKRAADLLVEHVNCARSGQDPLVFPIVFLYRQYIELRLKEIIKHSNLLLDNSEEPPKHHKIHELWSQARRIIEEQWPDESTEDINEVEGLIQQFSEKDPISMAFRYPKDKKDAPSLPGLKIINPRNLSEVVERIASILDGVSMGISHYLDQKWEMQEYFQNSFENTHSF